MPTVSPASIAAARPGYRDNPLLRALPAQCAGSSATPGQRRLLAGAALDLRPARIGRGAPRSGRVAEQVEQQIPAAVHLGGREHRGDADLLPIAAVTPQAHEIDQYAGAAEPGDQTPHAYWSISCACGVTAAI